jgi:putative membrane protein
MNLHHNITALIADSNWHHHGAWWFPFGLLWFAVLAAAVFLVVRKTGHRTPSATEILAERYARGELSNEEYRERLAELRSQQ